MKHKARHAGPSVIVRIATRGGVIASAAVIAAVGAGALTPGTANASTTPLQVTLSQSGDGAQAAFNAQGDITLEPGTATSTTYAEAQVTSIGAPATAPATPPSFTTDSYAAGSPRWVLKLANGNYLEGYPAQLPDADGNPAFTGDQWSAVGSNGSSLDSDGAYETYQQALSDAGDSDGSVDVTNAYLVADGDQPAGTVDTLTDVTYDGQTLSQGVEIVVSYPDNVSDPADTPLDVKPIDNGTNASDNTLAWTATGLPAGLSINSATGEITGTPTTAGTYTVTGTATDVYGQSNSAQFTLTVTPAVPYVAVGGTNGKLENVYSGKYLNVMADTYAPGSKLAQWDASGASHETFQYVRIVENTGTVVGGYLQATEDAAADKWYYVTASGEGQLTLGAEVQHPTSAVLAGVLTSGEDAIRTGNYFEFPNDSDHVADDSGWSTANGAPVIAYPHNGGKNQEWTMP